MAKKSKQDEEATFEEVVERLESVVERLERGDLALEDSLAAFEEGVRLSRAGSSRLDAAEKRVEELLANGKTRALTSMSDYDARHDDKESASR